MLPDACATPGRSRTWPSSDSSKDGGVTPSSSLPKTESPVITASVSA